MSKKILCGLILIITMFFCFTGCGSSDPAGIAGSTWYMVLAGSEYELDVNSDGTAQICRTDYAGDMTQSKEFSWEASGENYYEFTKDGEVFDGYVYDIDESDFTSNQILELGLDGEYLYFVQNSEDAQTLFNYYGGMQPDFIE